MSGSGPWTETQTSAQAVIGCSYPPPPNPLIIMAGVRRGRDLQVAHQSPETAAGTRQLTVRPTGRVRGDGCWVFQM